MEFPTAVADVLRKAECQHLFTMEGDRVKCTLNGHCIPVDSIGVIERFVGGKKFKKLAGRQQVGQQLQKFEPFLVPSTRLKEHLFCALTGQLIKASVEAARKHMKGQRFLKAKERFMEDDMDLLEEPEDTAKPERRANHRLQPSGDAVAELRAAAEPEGGADTSPAGSGDDSSNADDHATMDALLESDDSMAPEDAAGADSDTAAADAAGPEAAVVPLSASSAKRKRGQQSAVGAAAAGAGGGKRQRGRVAGPPEDSSVAGATKVATEKNGLASKKVRVEGVVPRQKTALHKKNKAADVATVGRSGNGAEKVPSGNDGAAKLPVGKGGKQKKSRGTNKTTGSGAGAQEAPSTPAIANGAAAQGRQNKRQRGGTGKAGSTSGEAGAGQGGAGARTNKANGESGTVGSKARGKGTRGRAARV